jgi:hypothetical protein
MIVTASNTVTDRHGRVIAGPFASNAGAWRWVDLNTNEGLEHPRRPPLPCGGSRRISISREVP